MGLYRQLIFPWLCDCLLGRPFVARYRQELLAQAQGDILEIGLGTGLNLPHYPRTVRKITAVEPNAGMQRQAKRRAATAGIEVDQRASSGMSLPFADAVFDCVVSTFTLCSIDAVSQALAETYRVLKPGGCFLFLEHGLSRDPVVQKWQRRMNRLEQWLADGCRLDRDIKALIEAQPFGSVALDEFDLERTPRTHGHLYRGVARRG
jgi:ubiquinone/menaquinone biosynthesis C-methylase UbiE